MLRSSRLTAAVVALAVLIVASGTATVVAAPAREPVTGKPSRELDWKSCGDKGECAQLTVPLDYQHPDNGQTLKVALFRLRATDRKHRIGSLLMNPGGPGAPGAEFVRSIESVLPDEIRKRFDVIGFDPRGSGETHPVKCRDNLDDVFTLDYSPDTQDERARLDAGLQQLAQSCEQRSGDVLPYVSSEDTARDMDRIRRAVGDKALTYVGYSYGTYIGTLYAKLFPKQVRTLVFDGALDPNLSGVDLALQQAVGFERSLDAFLAQCARNNRCPFYNAGDPAGAFDRLMAQVDAQALPARNKRVLGGGEFDLAVAQALYAGDAGYMQLEQALAAAQRGDGDRMLRLADQYTGRRRDGTYDSSQPAFWAIGCLDGPVIGGPDAFQAAEDRFRAAAPRMGVPLLNAGLICAYWPVPPEPSPAPVRIDGTPPIVVIGTTNDPATPVQWAESLAREISSGVLLTAEGTQHTSFLLADNACVDSKVISYLVDRKPPPDHTMCPH
ncbi:MAG TPA: alpha/beta hydrolase [Acidimicrobiia bacterium]